MLLGTSNRVFGESALRSLAVLERRFRAHLVVRDRLVFDSRFATPACGGNIATLYLVLEGHLQASGGPIRGPRVAHLLAETEFERVEPTSLRFRSWGQPSITLEILLRIEDVRMPVGLAHGPIHVSDTTWTVLRAMADAFLAGDATEPPIRDLLRSLARDGVVSGDVDSSVTDEPEQLVRVWSGIRHLYAAQATSASIVDVSKITGLSIRQVFRDFRLLTKTFSLPGERFRDLAKMVRIRTAVILLSAPGATATEVARQVGYRSLEAMGAAFREARLPAPSVVHEQVRFDAMPAPPGSLEE